jgi:uncharacterized protein YjbJ (UPF0337 family)
MGWDEIERSWNELKGEVKRQWSKLTDEDVELIRGKYTELLGLLQERYGHAKEQTESGSRLCAPSYRRANRTIDSLGSSATSSG